MQPPAQGHIFLITGIMASGKSSVAQALAERIPQSVHVRGDLFRRMIVDGQEPATSDNWIAAERQLHLWQDIAVQVAATFADSGYSVVYQDVMLGNDLRRLAELLDWPNRWPCGTSIATTPGMARGPRTSSIARCEPTFPGSVCGSIR